MEPDKLKRFLTAMDGDNLGLTEKDFIDSFERVVEFVKALDQRLTGDVQKAAQLLAEKVEQLEASNGASVSDMKGKLDELFVGEKVGGIEAALRKIVDEKLGEVDGRMSTVKDGARGPEGKPGKAGKDGSPDSPEQVVSKVNKSETKIKRSQVEGLEDEFKKISKAGMYTHSGGGGGSGGGKVVKYYDISDQLNGSLKTFVLPAFFRVISVHSSSQPFILRPTTDWTADGAAMTITFTSAVDETITLATGQSVVVIYSES
jgi:hypothetical protein